MRYYKIHFKKMAVCLMAAVCFMLQGVNVSAWQGNTIYMEEEQTPLDATGLDSSVMAPSAVLMEPSTGTVIYEKNADEQLRPASITKIMTLILIFDALDEGTIRLEDMVTTSEHAAGMGGSQVFLEQNEQQTVDTMIKCIAVASANDACVE